MGLDVLKCEICGRKIRSHENRDRCDICGKTFCKTCMTTLKVATLKGNTTKTVCERCHGNYPSMTIVREKHPEGE